LNQNVYWDTIVALQSVEVAKLICLIPQTESQCLELVIPVLEREGLVIDTLAFANTANNDTNL